MNHQDGQNFIEREEKTNRKLEVEYNETKLQKKVWKSAALLKVEYNETKLQKKVWKSAALLNKTSG